MVEIWFGMSSTGAGVCVIYIYHEVALGFLDAMLQCLIKLKPFLDHVPVIPALRENDDSLRYMGGGGLSGKMPQWIDHLLCKYGDLHSNPQHLHNSQVG